MSVSACMLVWTHSTFNSVLLNIAEFIFYECRPVYSFFDAVIICFIELDEKHFGTLGF